MKIFGFKMEEVTEVRSTLLQKELHNLYCSKDTLMVNKEFHMGKSGHGVREEHIRWTDMKGGYHLTDVDAWEDNIESHLIQVE
jgi:hypothetical protein